MTDFSLPCPATGKLSKTTVFLNLFVLPLFPKLSLNSVLGVTLEWQGPETLSAHSRVGDEAFPGKGPGPLTGPKQNWAASVAGLTLSRSFRSKPAWDSAVSWTPPHSRFFPPPPPVLWSHYFSERRLRLAGTRLPSALGCGYGGLVPAAESPSLRTGRVCVALLLLRRPTPFRYSHYHLVLLLQIRPLVRHWSESQVHRLVGKSLSGPTLSRAADSGPIRCGLASGK